MNIKWKLTLLLMAALMWWSGYHIGKHAADLWWQADEAKKAQTYPQLENNLWRRR